MRKHGGMYLNVWGVFVRVSDTGPWDPLVLSSLNVRTAGSSVGNPGMEECLKHSQFYRGTKYSYH